MGPKRRGTTSRVRCFRYVTNSPVSILFCDRHELLVYYMCVDVLLHGDVLCVQYIALHMLLLSVLSV